MFKQSNTYKLNPVTGHVLTDARLHCELSQSGIAVYFQPHMPSCATVMNAEMIDNCVHSATLRLGLAITLRFKACIHHDWSCQGPDQDSRSHKGLVRAKGGAQTTVHHTKVLSQLGQNRTVVFMASPSTRKREDFCCAHLLAWDSEARFLEHRPIEHLHIKKMHLAVCGHNLP